MGLRSFFTLRRTPAAAESSAAVVATERAQLTPALLADLDAAWAELRQAATEAGVMSIQACTRDGSRWQDDPQSVRAMAETIRHTQKYTAEGIQDGPER